MSGGVVGGSFCLVVSSCESAAGIGLTPGTSSDSTLDFGVYRSSVKPGLS
jgi:hypothetical protein